jgi:hypothetical protein
MDRGEVFCGTIIEYVSKTFGEPAVFVATAREDAQARDRPYWASGHIELHPSENFTAFVDHVDKCLQLAKQMGRPALQEMSDKWDNTACDEVTSFFRFVPHQKVEAVIRHCDTSMRILSDYRQAQWEALGIALPTNVTKS